LATVAVFGDSRCFFRRQIVAEIGDYSLQCGQGFSLSSYQGIITVDDIDHVSSLISHYLGAFDVNTKLYSLITDVHR